MTLERSWGGKKLRELWSGVRWTCSLFCWLVEVVKLGLSQAVGKLSKQARVILMDDSADLVSLLN